MSEVCLPGGNHAFPVVPIHIAVCLVEQSYVGIRNYMHMDIVGCSMEESVLIRDASRFTTMAASTDVH